MGSCQWEMQWHTPSPQTQCACIRLTRDKYRVSLKKGTLVVFVLFLFLKMDFAFSHAIWNQNLEPISSSHLELAHSENQVP